MPDIIPNVVVSMPSQLFTLARKFQAASNGKIYIGKIDTDPTLPENQIQVYLENEDGSHTPVAQPLIINQAGFPVYNGQIAKFVTVEGHSMAVYDSYGAQQHYYPNVLKYDPDQFESRLLAGDGSLIGTNHRGNLALDLDAIDRRPDGYNNDIQAVLDNGNDVEINKDYIIEKQLLLKNNQLVSGVGGKIHVSDSDQMSSHQHCFYADKEHVANNVRINGIMASGSTTPSGDYGAFAIYLEGSKNPEINGVNASGFSGAVALRNTDSATAKDIKGSGLIYNHANARGGYGVILDECRDTIIDGVQFKATDNINNNDGRHLLYISQGGNYHEYNGCLNTICTNTIANYKNKNNRNHWAYNIRKSKRNILSNFIADGGNGGIANNNERGPIENSIYTSGHIHQVQYENGIGVYGTSFVSNNEHHSTGWIINSVISEISVKDDSITGADSIGFGVSGNHGILSSCITKVPQNGIPIMIQPNTNNLVIDGIIDYTEKNETTGLTPMILFSGGIGTMRNITVKGVRTNRPIFGRITAAIDVTVDFSRKAMVSIKNGDVTNQDEHQLIDRVAVGDAGISIVMHNHVTQHAIDSCYVRMFSNQNQGIDGYTVITSTGNKTVGVRFYNPSGQLLNPKQSPLLSCLLVIHS
ncbi:phage head-binding domain-containing protein [Proteus penneri]|uniref:phage head-binding domain-containing protein n=1 Tax=Proteus penneri TaxID=102862 RepID=UPI000DFF25FF|nr:phage head-binding domain-containing protein [Proteus penneri]SUB99991.1 Head binding [Proteus penneri]